MTTKEPEPERYIRTKKHHGRETARELSLMFKNKMLSDVVIKCGEKDIQAHKLVLAIHSAYFRQYLEVYKETQQIILNGLDYEIVKIIIDYMCFGKAYFMAWQINYIALVAILLQINDIKNFNRSILNREDRIPFVFNMPPPTYSIDEPHNAMIIFIDLYAASRQRSNNARIQKNAQALKQRRRCSKRIAKRIKRSMDQYESDDEDSDEQSTRPNFSVGDLPIIILPAIERIIEEPEPPKIYLPDDMKANLEDLCDIDDSLSLSSGTTEQLLADVNLDLFDDVINFEIAED